MSRSFGGTRLTTRLPIAISPSVMSSRPAIMRSSVDLPQPDGPTSTQNSPSAIAMSTPWTTSVLPNDFLTRDRVTDAIPFSFLRFGYGPRAGLVERAGMLGRRGLPSQRAGARDSELAILEIGFDRVHAA